MKISIACDHGALTLKNKMVTYLTDKGYEVKDFGTYTEGSCDYPEYAAAAARAVASGECEKGIVMCTTGIGMSIAANKIQPLDCKPFLIFVGCKPSFGLMNLIRWKPLPSQRSGTIGASGKKSRPPTLRR